MGKSFNSSFNFMFFHDPRRSETIRVDPTCSDPDWRSELIRSDFCTRLIHFVSFRFAKYSKRKALDFIMRTIYTFCALALARSLLLVSGDDEKKDEQVKNDVGFRTTNSVGIGIDLGSTYSW